MQLLAASRVHQLQGSDPAVAGKLAWCLTHTAHSEPVFVLLQARSLVLEQQQQQ